MSKHTLVCPCGTVKPYPECCGRYIDTPAAAPTAEALMRSRYTAYTQLNETYLLATWHASTRPTSLALATETPTKWLGLTVKNHQQPDETHATVTFTARYKINGRAYSLHEISRFVREEAQWFYVDGVVG
jgi:SEC-C motif-containing protein